MEKKKGTNAVAIVGFVFAIVSVLTFGFPSAVGLTLSIIGLAIAKKYTKPLKGLAIAGLIISSICFVVFWVIVITSALSDTNVITNGISNSNTNTTSNAKTLSKPVEKYVTVDDFSTTTESETRVWCKTFGANCNITTEYNDEVENGKLISQSVAPNEKVLATEEITFVYSLGHKETLGEANALKRAKSYLNSLSFSYSGLVSQLEFEGYSNAEATYAVDRCGADWNEQAAKKAKSYLRSMAFSREGLIDQLEFEGFTYEQAVYGVTQNGY